MKKALLITGIILILISGLLTACGGGSSEEGSIYGEYRLVDKAAGDLIEYRLALKEDGTVSYKISGITHGIGEWVQQGDSLLFQFDGYNIVTTLNDGQIIGGTNSTILKGTWEKVK